MDVDDNYESSVQAARHSKAYMFLISRWGGSIVVVALISAFLPDFLLNNGLVDFIAGVVPSVNIWSRNVDAGDSVRFVWAYMIFSFPFFVLNAVRIMNFFNRQVKNIEGQIAKGFFVFIMIVGILYFLCSLFFVGSVFGIEMFSERTSFQGSSGSAMSSFYAGRLIYSILLGVSTALVLVLAADLLWLLFKNLMAKYF